MNSQNDATATQPVAVYVHGLASGAKGSTALELERRYPQFRWVMEDFGESLAENVAHLNEMVLRENPLLIIGTSMGGLTTLYAEAPNAMKVVCNPALSIADCVREKIGLGVHTYFCERVDGETEFELTEQMCCDYEHYIATHPLLLGERNYALFSAHDELLGDEAAERAKRVVADCGYEVLIDRKGSHRLGSSALKILHREIISPLILTTEIIY